MTIIRVTPEILVLTSHRMAQVNGDIRAAVADLSSVLNGLGGEYDGQLRNQVASKVGQAQGAASGPTNQVNALTLELNKRAQLFAAADGQSMAFAGSSAQLRDMFGQDLRFNLFGQLLKIPDRLYQYLRMGNLFGSENWELKLESLGKLSGLLGVPAALAINYRLVDGKVILSAAGHFLPANWIREFAGLNATRIIAANIPGSMAKGAWAGMFTKPLTKLAVIGVMIDLVPQYLSDIRAYSSDLPKMFSAIAVDTLLKPITNVIGSSIGYWIGGTIVVVGLGALGIAASPAIVIVGGVIGAVIIGGLISDTAFKWLNDNGVRGALIDAVETVVTRDGEFLGNLVYGSTTSAAELASKTSEAVSDATQNVLETGQVLVNQAAKAVDNILNSAVSAIQNISNPKLLPGW